MPKLNHLSQEVINQIAAGEVVERPASVVKEFIDNSIDAKATHIKIKIEEGGLKLIEVWDNGIGIEKDNIKDIFLPHTTSKLSSIEDLNKLSTMGFRGEALSTIKSVSNVLITSKNIDSDQAYSINFTQSDNINKGARDTGTTITIQNLFFNTPARLKFMKSAETEYRKILEVMTQYCISYPNIHFELIKDNKQILNIPPKDLKGRIKDLLKKDYVDRMLELKSEGAGLKISGYIANPRDTVQKGAIQYVFVNNRPIWDNGISKSVHQGYSRFIPHLYKVPFIIFLNIDNSQIDVNVHPRKEEIKFINPYRVYSQIEEAVSHILQKSTQAEYSESSNKNIINSKDSFFDNSNIRYTQENKIKEIRFDKKPSDFSIRKGLDFSKKVLDTSNFTNSSNQLPFDNNSYENMTANDQSFKEFRNIFQIFNKYIVIEFDEILWLIDQHAAAERINFEKLSKQYQGDINDIQQLLVAEIIELNDFEMSFIQENSKLFIKLGFGVLVNDDKLEITHIPAHLVGYDIKNIFKNIFNLEDLNEIKNNFDRLKTNILATIACHGSVRAGQKLNIQECENIYRELGQCNNPFSCPHGRPAVWKLKLSDIDTNFYRTY